MGTRLNEHKPNRQQKGTSVALQKLRFFKAKILNPQTDESCEFYPEGLLVIKNDKIKDVLPLEKGLKKYRALMTSSNTKDFGTSVIMPGLFDMHFHWVQDEVREMPKDSLLAWLENYTFPTEAKFANKKYAQKRAKVFFQKLSSMGTIAGACYSSIHESALNEAMKNVKGQFVIGNVLMNMNSPKELTQSESDSLKLTKKMIKRHGKKFCFTPRFAITTSPKVMKEGSKLADRANCFKQTHLSETPQEIDFVLSIFRNLPGYKKVRSYTEIYQKSGMLGKKSLMGHAIHLSNKELKILKSTKTSVIHCPTSNAPLKEKGLGSGLFDFRRIEKSKISWALGSDIGGGPFLSMFDVMRSFVDQNQKKGIKKATYVKALFRSTMASAKIMGQEKNMGNFKAGKEANFIIVSVPSKMPARNAEETLRNIIAPLKLRRESYSKLVSGTCYRGKFLYLKK